VSTRKRPGGGRAGVRRINRSVCPWFSQGSNLWPPRIAKTMATTMIYAEDFEEAFNKHDLDFQACASCLSITCVSKVSEYYELEISLV
jgi:hypothetical protein